MDDLKYRAFISYSWADAKWGNWLHQQLETYRTPAALVGKDGAHGKVPARINPIFKDREEEAAGSSIGDAVEKALVASEFLIVICSPNSAQSKWVDREIAFFKTHRDPDKVLALIVDGEPGSADAECFPKALTHRVGSDLTLGDSLADAPLAADARITGDGKRRAKLKIAAAMLGVGLDELVNRDERRRTIRTRIVVSASVALALVMSGLAWVAVQARTEAERQRNEAESLVEFMLTDLREKLEPVGRLDALDVVGERALTYYAGQNIGSLDADALGRRARALHLVGEISNLRGDSEEALRAFREAAASTREQLARDPDNQQRIFDHSQGVFWVGYIAYARGEMEEAESQFREYQRLAARLVELDPDNTDWQLESSYAETNIGVMLREQGRHEEAEPAFATGLERIEAVAASEGFDPGRQVELGTTINWLAMTKDSLGKYEEALELHRREVRLYEGLLERDPNNAQAKNSLSVALQYVGRQHLNQGELVETMAAYDRSLELNAELRRLDPQNTAWMETGVRANFTYASAYILSDQLADGRRKLNAGRAILREMLAMDETNTEWAGELRSIAYLNETQLALANQNLPAAERFSRLAVNFGEAGNKSAAWRAEVRRLAGDVQIALGRRDRAHGLWSEALDLVPVSPSTEYLRFVLYTRLGRAEEAAEMRSRLDRRGFRYPAYTEVL
ncbi:TIR domain-containing protein [Erythrobacter alti]|uniref:TIR domain-containing protein n=1 Tax=Erythrobacter alti TaxID=1896145 RepID=UPI0030F3DF9B